MSAEAAPESMQETVHVALGERSYDIRIGADLLGRAGEILRPMATTPRVAVVSDETVASLHLPALKAALEESGFRVDAVALPPGESTKSFAQLEALLGRLLDLKIARDDLLIALGGGVIGDLAGFAAAILRRGIAFAQIPTTLLAQVDSSVGGKTGINTPHGKNLVGAFHQPASVIVDIALLDTLPERELLAGYAEVAKYGLLGDRGFFEWLETNGAALKAGDRAARTRAVTVSCAAKAAIVARDETEAGDRALLNLGHTFGHALEAATGYSSRLLHGEGVAVGMVMAFETSARMGLCPQEEPSRVAAHLAAMGLPTRLTEIDGALPDAEGLMALMAQDKKVKGGRPTFILVRGIGEAFRTQEADLSVVRSVLDDALAARGA